LLGRLLRDIATVQTPSVQTSAPSHALTDGQARI
jgi:hypothetical protein